MVRVVPNGILAQERLAHAITAADRSNNMVAVLLLDLDRFKDVNDTLGHAAGDVLLKEVASHLKEVVRDQDALARLGGDEFTVVLTGLKSRSELEPIIENIFRALRPVIKVGDQDLHTETSVGIALFPSDGSDSETLLQHADVALYQAKNLGGNTYQFYDSTMHQLDSQRLILENSLRTALEEMSSYSTTNRFLILNGQKHYG